MNANQDIDTGRAKLVFFHNRAVGKPEYPFSRISELYDYVNQKNPFLLEGIGFAVSAAGVSDTVVREVYEDVADDGNGKLPGSAAELNRAFIMKLASPATDIKVWDALKSVSADTISDLAQGAAEVGNQVVETGKNAISLLPIIPLILFGGALYYLNQKASRL